MAKQKTMTYCLLLMAVLVLTLAAVTIGTGNSLARYDNSTYWSTIVLPEEATLSSDCLRDGGQIILLGEITDDTDVDFSVWAKAACKGFVELDIDPGYTEYLRVELADFNDRAVDSSVVLSEEETVFRLKIYPLESARELREELQIDIFVSVETEREQLEGAFRLILPAAEMEEGPEDSENEEPTNPETGGEGTDGSGESGEPTDPETGGEGTGGSGESSEPTALETGGEDTGGSGESGEPTAPETGSEGSGSGTSDNLTGGTGDSGSTLPDEGSDSPGENEGSETPDTGDSGGTAGESGSNGEATEPSEDGNAAGSGDGEIGEVEEKIEFLGTLRGMLSTVSEFSLKALLPVGVDVPDGCTRLKLALFESDLPAYTRYSLDNGETWYMLYYGGAVEVEEYDIQSLPVGYEGYCILLDFSGTEFTESEPLVFYTEAYTEDGYYSDDAPSMAFMPVTNTHNMRVPLILRENSVLALPVTESWPSEIGVEMRLEQLVLQQNMTELQETQEYAVTEFTAVTDGSISAELDADSVIITAGETRPAAGTYRLTLVYNYNGIDFSQSEVVFFVNYSEG